MSGIFGGQSKRSQGICDDIRGCRQILTGSRRQIHNAVNAVQHILGFPACHRHVIHSFCGFGCGELRLFSHFACFVPKRLQVIPSCAGHSSNLTHGRLKICCCLNCRHSQTGNRGRRNRHLLSDARNGIACAFHLAAHHIDLFQRGIGGDCLLLQSLQFLLGLDDFTLQRVVLVLTERAAFQLLLRLNLCFLQ